MDNIQLCYIDNEINKIDKMKQGDVIYKNGMELLVVLSYDHNEPCKGCFFYKNKACGSEKLIKCWDCKKEYIFTAIRKYNTTELCGIVKRYEETYKIILKTIKKIEKECQKYVIWDTVHVMLKDDGELIIKALSKDKSVPLNDFIIYVNNNGSIDEEDYDLFLVNHLASLDNERERMITVISGRKCLESYERQDRSGLLARMLLESPIWFNPVVKLTWKRKVIKMKKITRKRYLSKNISSIPSATILNVKDIPSNRSLFQLAVSERHTRGTGYGSLLPTVQTQGLKVCDKDGKTRFMDLSSLPKQGIKYGDLLPTPVASDHTGSCTIRKMTKSNGAPRTDSLRNMPAVIGMDGDRLNGRVFQLSPLFVEEMMGYPLMWTTLPFLTGNGEKNQ